MKKESFENVILTGHIEWMTEEKVGRLENEEKLLRVTRKRGFSRPMA